MYIPLALGALGAQKIKGMFGLGLVLNLCKNRRRLCHWLCESSTIGHLGSQKGHWIDVVLSEIEAQWTWRLKSQAEQVKEKPDPNSPQEEQMKEPEG